MTDTMQDSPFHSIANPRRTTLVTVSAAEAAAPFTMVGSDDGAVCVDGVCALPE